MFVSWAKILDFNFFDDLGKSLIYSRNSGGPKVDP